MLEVSRHGSNIRHVRRALQIAQYMAINKMFLILRAFDRRALYAGKQRDGGQNKGANTAQDVWSLCAILFELVSGVPLFEQLKTPGAKMELVNWLTVDHERLELIMTDTENIMAHEATLRHLIRWGLRREGERPTVHEMLQHPFTLATEIDRSQLIASAKHQFHFFISHYQAEAADIVKVLYFEAKARKCNAWIDMKAEIITEDGMADGVNQSEMFVCVLTSNVIFRPFCAPSRPPTRTHTCARRRVYTSCERHTHYC